MKKSILFASIVAPLLLSGCIFGNDDSWKKKYGTPELFLENVVGNRYVSLYEDQNQTRDVNYEIRDAIKESGPFESTEKTSSSAERYFTYQGFWQAATSGPNFCYMSIWEDGFIQIHHKYSLGAHSYVYFSMDKEKALSLNDMVFERVMYRKQIVEEDEAQAKIDGSIENFFFAMEKKRSVHCIVAAKEGASYNTYNFEDNGEMLYVMRQAKYTPADRLQGDSSFWYNNGENWHFRLWGNTTARIEYHYTNRLGEEDAIALIYSLEGAKGQDILDKALEIAKRSN